MMLRVEMHALIVFPLYFLAFVHYGDAFIHHDFHLEKISLTCLHIKLGSDNLPLFAVIFFVGRRHRLLNGFQDFFFRNFSLFL